MSVKLKRRVVSAIATMLACASPAHPSTDFIGQYISGVGGCNFFNYYDVGTEPAPYGKEFLEWTEADIALYAHHSIRCLHEVSERRHDHPHNAQVYREQFQNFLPGVYKLLRERTEENAEQAREANQHKRESDAAAANEQFAAEFLDRMHSFLRTYPALPKADAARTAGALLAEYGSRESDLSASQSADALATQRSTLQNAYLNLKEQVAAPSSGALVAQSQLENEAPDSTDQENKGIIDSYLDRSANTVSVQCELSESIVLYGNPLQPGETTGTVTIDADLNEGDTILIDGNKVQLSERRGTIIAFSASTMFKKMFSDYLDTLTAAGALSQADRDTIHQQLGLGTDKDLAEAMRALGMVDVTAFPRENAVVIIDLEDGSAVTGRMEGGQLVGGGPVACQKL